MAKPNFDAWREEEGLLLAAAKERGHKQADVLNALFQVKLFDYKGLNEVRVRFGLEPIPLDDDNQE